jgi:hypothetical protein
MEMYNAFAEYFSGDGFIVRLSGLPWMQGTILCFSNSSKCFPFENYFITVKLSELRRKGPKSCLSMEADAHAFVGFAS